MFEIMALMRFFLITEAVALFTFLIKRDGMSNAAIMRSIIERVVFCILLPNRRAFFRHDHPTLIVVSQKIVKNGQKQAL